MHKKLLICLFLIFLSPSIAYATYIGTNNGVYKFESTLTKCESYNSTTSAWVTLWDYTSNTANAPKVDLGAGSVGAQMGTYMSNISVPIGTYTQMRVTILTTVKLRGWALVSGTYYYTDVSDTTYQTGSQGTVPSDATCTEVTMTPPPGSNMPTSFTQTTNITGGGLVVSAGGSGGVSIIFPMEQLFTAQDIGQAERVITPGEVTPTISPI